MELRRWSMPHTVVRARTVAELHERGLTYGQIGEKFGVSRERIRQLCNIHIQLTAMGAQEPPPELSVRLHNALANSGEFSELTPEAVRRQYPTLALLQRLPGMGEKTIAELQEWLIKHGCEVIS